MASAPNKGNVNPESIHLIHHDEKIILNLSTNSFPGSYPVVFAPVNSTGVSGTLNTEVLNKINSTSDEKRKTVNLPGKKDLEKGFHWDTTSERSVGFIGTVGYGEPEEALYKHLLAALDASDWRDNAWIPLMGTGTAELKEEDSFIATLRAIKKHVLKDKTKKERKLPFTVTIDLLPDVYEKYKSEFIGIAKNICADYEESNEDTEVTEHPDLPSDEDLLNRKPLVRNIARYISRLWERNEGFSYMMHLDGPWGSGKSSLLMQLKKEMQINSNKDKNWVVIEFNAWMHQHISPPWWSLMDKVYTQAKSQIKGKISKNWAWVLCLKETWRRIKMGRVIALAIIALIFIVASTVLGTAFIAGKREAAERSKEQQTHKSDADEKPKKKEDRQEGFLSDVGEFSAFIAALSGAVSTILLFSQNVFALGSARSAKSFVSKSKDPMGQVKNHFNSLIKDIQHPVAIFIDDMDRCNPSYVVSLLEGIQTMFKDTKVFYIVAGDKNWICTCFEEHYSKFKDNMNSEGNRLGDLFIQKSFQMSAQVPIISKDQKEVFLKSLLKRKESKVTGQNGSDEQPDTAITQTANPFKGLTTEKEVLKKYNRMDVNPDQLLEMQEHLLAQLSKKEVQESTEHELTKFAGYLEPNPRSIKRLLNFYNIRRDIMLLEGREVQREFLIRWLILTTRWPILADFLENQPSAIMPGATAPDHIKKLIGLEAVQDVLTGKLHDSHLAFTREAIINCSVKMSI